MRLSKRVVVAAVVVVVVVVVGGLRLLSYEERWVLREWALDALHPATIELAYPIARSHALQWQPTASLNMVVAAFPVDDIDTEPDEILYNWVTQLEHGRQGQAWITAYPKAGLVQIETWRVTETERPEPGHLAFESAVVSSRDALRAAEAAGGKGYRESHANTLVVIRGDPGLLETEMTWTVKYMDASSRSEGFWFAMRAQSGEVIYPRE